MSNYLLRRQVDEVFNKQFFTKRPTIEFSAWKKFKSELKSQIKTPTKSKDSRTPAGFYSETSPLPKLFKKKMKKANQIVGKSKEFFNKLFRTKSSDTQSSIDSLSEITAKEHAMISVKSSLISEILPLELIRVVKEVLKNCPSEEEYYLQELRSLSDELENYLKDTEI